MKQFSIFKVQEKKSPNAPDYEIVASVQKADGSYDRHYVGKCWAKTSQKGVKYLSCSLNDTRVYNDKTYMGYSIHADTAEKPAEAKNEPKQDTYEARPSAGEDDYGSEIPFN